jgi:hypothetical protein
MMASMKHWHEAFEVIRPHVFLVETPMGSGSGFLVATTGDRGMVGIATAGHVIEHAFKWNQPIRVFDTESKKGILLEAQNRAILGNWGRDAAAIVFEPQELPMPAAPLSLIPPENRIKVGVEIAWMGFPGVTDRELCFFSGAVSRYRPDNEEYLVDGVAINGVSGGPAMQLKPSGPRLIGLVSAYIPNRLTGGSLPGLCVIKDISSLKQEIQTIVSFRAAKAKEQASAESLPPEPPSIPPTQPGVAGEGPADDKAGPDRRHPRSRRKRQGRPAGSKTA